LSLKCFMVYVVNVEAPNRKTNPKPCYSNPIDRYKAEVRPIVEFSSVLKFRTERETCSKQHIYLSCHQYYRNKMSNTDKKLALLAGILAAGIFSAAFASTQFLSANAQSTNSTDDNGNVTGDNPMPVDIGCPTGAQVCEDNNNNNTEQRATVSTSGTATTKVQPDKFSVTVGLVSNGTTAKEAADRNAEQIAKVIAALKALGIPENNITTSSYNVYPVYESKQGADQCITIYPTPPECLSGNVITGYRASSSLTVTLDAGGNIDAGQVIDTAISAGANTVQGAYFFVSQQKQMEVQAGLINQAIENARQRATIAASAVGMGVDRVKSISLNDVYFPVFARDATAASASTSATQILPGQQDVTLTVNVVYFITG